MRQYIVADWLCIVALPAGIFLLRVCRVRCLRRVYLFLFWEGALLTAAPFIHCLEYTFELVNAQQKCTTRELWSRCQRSA